MYSHEFSTEPQMRVVYDAVGKLKGEIIESNFVPIDKLSPDRKVHARELLGSLLKEKSAFGERYDTSFSDEDSLLKEFPYRSSGLNASTNSSLQGSSSQTQSTVVPNNLYGSAPPASLGSRETGELYNPVSAPFMDLLISGGGPLADLGYDTHEAPSLLDEVSQLLNVYKDYEIFECVGYNRVTCVEDFNAVGRRFKNHYTSPTTTSMLSDEACVNWGRDVRSFNDMQHSSTSLGGGGSNRMVGESSSGHSNSSFHSAMSMMTTILPWAVQTRCCITSTTLQATTVVPAGMRRGPGTRDVLLSLGLLFRQMGGRSCRGYGAHLRKGCQWMLVVATRRGKLANKGRQCVPLG